MWSACVRALLAIIYVALPTNAKNAENVVIKPETPLVVPQTDALQSPLRTAFRDIKADWYKRFSIPPLVLHETPVEWTLAQALPVPVVYLGSLAGLAPLLGDAPVQQFGSLLVEGVEGHACAVLDVNTTTNVIPVVCSAQENDILGTVYGMYALSEHVLGINPQSYWVEWRTEAVTQIVLPANFTFVKAPPAFRYRVFFVNDEDQLGGFRADPAEENVFSLEAWNQVYSTLLRLGGNGVLVGTIPFADEKSLDLANKRGLYIGEHHFMVLGTNTFRFPEGVPYSYPFNPDIVTKIWRMLVQKQVEQGRNMLWTVGYRGLNDYPFWNDDPSYDTPEKRGALISEVIQVQVGIIRNETQKAGLKTSVKQGEEQIFTYLWDEAEELYAQGFLKIPKGVTLVHADDGTGIITSDSNLIGPGDGIYYHIMMENVGSRNQLTEMVPPERIFRQLGEMAKKNATKLMQINTSDLRAVALTLKAVMDLAWDPAKWLSLPPEEAANIYIEQWSAEQYGKVGSEVAKIYQGYFSIPYLVDNATRYGEQYFSHQIREAAQAIVDYLNKTATTLPTKQATLNQKLLMPVQDYLTSLSQRASALLPSIPAPRVSFFRSHCLTQIAIHAYGTEALLAASNAVLLLGQGQTVAALAGIEKAELAIHDGIFGAFRNAEVSDRWEGWFQHDELDNFFSVWDVLRQAKALLSSTACPPKRYWKGGTGVWSTEFDYQVTSPDPRAYPFFYLDSRFLIDAVVRVKCAAEQVDCTNTAIGGNFGNSGSSGNHGTYITLSTLSPSPLTIHYTTDGSEPVVSSPTYTQPFKISTNTTVNARAFAADGQPADVATRSRWQPL